jgi:hypothetical protein
VAVGLGGKTEYLFFESYAFRVQPQQGLRMSRFFSISGVQYTMKLAFLEINGESTFP